MPSRSPRFMMWVSGWDTWHAAAFHNLGLTSSRPVALPAGIRESCLYISSDVISLIHWNLLLDFVLSTSHSSGPSKADASDSPILAKYELKILAISLGSVTTLLSLSCYRYNFDQFYLAFILFYFDQFYFGLYCFTIHCYVVYNVYPMQFKQCSSG